MEIMENLATTKAQIVKALKAMTTSFLLGEKVSAILEKSTVWAEYKDQRHDLFISNTPTSCYLTGKETSTIKWIQKNWKEFIDIKVNSIAFREISYSSR